MLDLGDEAEPKTRAIVHLGAHKTASTHFNRVVRRNNHLLKEHSVSVPKKEDIRNLLTRFLSIDGKDLHLFELLELKEAKRNSLPALLAQRESLFLSDENILGTPRRLFARNMMYPNAQLRLKNAMGFFGDAEVTLMMAIRSQAEFITSSYCEAIRSHGFSTLGDYLGDMPVAEMRWTKLVRRLQKASKGAPMVIWTYEKYREILPQLLNITLGFDTDTDLDFRDMKKVVRPGMSQHALDEIASRNIRAEDDDFSAKIEEIMEKFPKSKEFPAPQLWNDEDRAILNKNYRQDLKNLTDLEGVTFLG